MRLNPSIRQSNLSASITLVPDLKLTIFLHLSDNPLSSTFMVSAIFKYPTEVCRKTLRLDKKNGDDLWIFYYFPADTKGYKSPKMGNTDDITYFPTK